MDTFIHTHIYIHKCKYIVYIFCMSTYDIYVLTYTYKHLSLSL